MSKRNSFSIRTHKGFGKEELFLHKKKQQQLKIVNPLKLKRVLLKNLNKNNQNMKRNNQNKIYLQLNKVNCK